MTSRLDRLFILLESGSSSVTRRAAAKQIGEVQRLHPHELHNLLNRVINYLQNGNWDTRIAAAQAVEAILNNTPKWCPKPVNTNGVKKEEEKLETTPPSSTSLNRFTFENFDWTKILEHGARLMGSEGTEFDFQDDKDDNINERLARQRQLLNEKFGLNSAISTGVTIDDIVTLDDMNISTSENHPKQATTTKLLTVQELLNIKPSNSEGNCSLSCREKNRAKRKARQNNTGSSSTLNRTNSCPADMEPETKKVKVEFNSEINHLNLNAPVPDATGSWGDTTDWPFENFSSKLFCDLMSPRWETRHGVATALRELIKTHADSAGKSCYMTPEEMEFNHQLWLEDAVLRLLCVLALDRFGDFVSDQVVAPVRETCAQVLGTVLKQMSNEKVEKCIEVLIMLTKRKDWEVRHGGLLGLKYLLVVREDLLTKFLPILIKDILAGLFDSVDDVGAVAASTLIPVVSWLPKLLSPEEVSNIVKMLWDLLLDQDELTSACNSFMGLLSSILCLPNALISIEMEPMAKLIPRLWPFLSHSSSSVRRSTLQTLLTLTQPTKLETVTSEKPPTTEKTMQLNFGVKDWPTELLQDSLRHVYQRVLVEHIDDIQKIAIQVWNNLVVHGELSALLHASCPWISSWLCLAMQPAKLAFDPSTLVFSRAVCTNPKLGYESEKPLQKMYLGGTETIPIDVRERNVIKARCNASQMLGLLSKFIVLRDPGVSYTATMENPIDRYTTLLIGYLNSRSALQRLISSQVIANWAMCDDSVLPGPPQLQEKLLACLNEYIYYDEVAILFTRLLQESRDFIATLKQHKIPATELENLSILTLDQIQYLCTTMTENLRTKHQLKNKIAEMMEDRRKSLQNSFTVTSREQNNLNISVQAALAGAVVCLKCLPEKLNPIIKPLMESIKREECELLQQMSAKYLVLLLDQISLRTPCPNSKIITNLCRLLKNDADFTPKIVFPLNLVKTYDPKNVTAANPYHGIITLNNKNEIVEVQTIRGPGRPPATDNNPEDAAEVDDPARKQNRIQRIGATFVINIICTHFNKDLKQKASILWEIMTDFITKSITNEYIEKLGQTEPIVESDTNDLVTALQLIEIASLNIDASLYDNLFLLLPKLCLLLSHPLKVIRHLASRCLAIFSTIRTSNVMDVVIENIVPILGSIENIVSRQGAVESIGCIINKLQYNIVPYVVLMIVPLLGRMSDPDLSVRLMSTHCFATLIQLMPLDGNTPELSDKLSVKLRAQKEIDRKFLNYLFAPKSIPDFKIPIPINAELRSYQQAGINWLWFLNKYKLHGILCDDMGLGKTLQTICILAGDHHQRQLEKMTPLPSIVICPPTLTGHWVYEIEKFLPNKFLRPLHYVGLPVDRMKLREKIKRFNLVVASYDIVRKDIEFFNSIHWNYCVLDEGHIIKNGKTKCSKAIKQVVANHRLILSGTPIQNNVLELWSLFDFLMPGFLGTEKEFMAKFSRPILASRDPKSSPKEQEAGALAMEGLHRQVLPFLLRRVKEDVLTDLPPKITQDLICELSTLQEKLYEDLSKTQLNDEIRNCLENIDSQQKINKTHVFQALRYLQNVCNHPKLVLKPHHPDYAKVQNELSRMNSSLDDIDHSGKLPALKQLLLDCGIGNDDISVNQHRALIFCQLKAMLDIIENDLLRKHLPAVSYLRLDGSVPASARHDIVTKFNNDPSIDVLLLTTQVGGLGLNLTGADTVIFVEHDWNPMKDLQAMDRAHRIGQKKVVNVYRLITRKSLEEKIMGLQKFKLLTANTVVSSENSSMESMGTDQLLDLFNLNEQQQNKNSNNDGASNKNGGSSSVKNILENLPELWDDRQYEEEYDLSQFLETLK